VLTVSSILEAQFGSEGNFDVTTAVILNVAATAPLLLARRYLPLAAVIAGGSLCGLLAVTGTSTVSGLVAQLWLLYLVASRYSAPMSALALLPLAGNAVYPYTGQGSARPVAVLLLCLGLVATALGYARRQVAVERESTRREVTKARRDQAAMTERSRIARELHDVVAHHVSMMVVRAETARVATAGMPEAGEQSLVAIRDTGRQALNEMRRLLTVLRADPNERADRRPQPGLQDLDELVESAREAGNDVRLHLQGTAEQVPDGVQLCAYRIVQEALTNVRRHAPGTNVELSIRYADERVTVVVHNDGPAPLSLVDGHGMVGLRERAAMVGGTLRAGPADGGGFIVMAELPTGWRP
jgi:signal transduction histidine kinase